MRVFKKELLSKILTCVLAISIPLLLLVLGIQAKNYADLSKEVADLVIYLSSDQSSYITGTNIDINGGSFFS